MPAQDTRAPKRARLADLDLDPALSAELATGDYPPAATSLNFQLPADGTAAFNQYHWPAEPASASSSAGLAGIVIPPLPSQGGIDPPLPMAMRFGDETLHSAAAAGAARSMGLAPPATAGVAKPAVQAMATRAGGAGSAAAYADMQGGEGEGDHSRRPSESELHIQVHGAEDEGEEGDNGHSQDGNPHRQTPFSRTPELKVHHKLAERQRRKEMKDLFDELREQLPTERGTKSSKWEILKREYIDVLRQGQSEYVAEIERLRREVEMLGGAPAGAYAAMGTAGGEGQLQNGEHGAEAGAVGQTGGQGAEGETGTL